MDGVQIEKRMNSFCSPLNPAEVVMPKSKAALRTRRWANLERPKFARTHE